MPAAVAGTILTVLGFYLAPPGGELWKVLFNQGLALFAIWVSAALGLYLHRTKGQREEYQNLLDHISRVQARFIADPGDKELFPMILEEVVAFSKSQFGFIGKALHDENGNPYLKIFGNAATNIAWNEETRKLYMDNAAIGMEFRNLDNLFGEVIKTGKPVIANDAVSDPRRGGIPTGHPTLHTYLGLPLMHKEKVLGMISLANRPGGYGESLVHDLQPLTQAYAGIVHTLQTSENLSRASQALVESQEQYRKVYEQWRYLIEGTSTSVGSEFFRSLVSCLASALQVRWVFVGELSPDQQSVHTLAVWDKDKIADNFEYFLKGTPCENVVGQKVCFYPNGVQQLFPKDELLVKMGVQGYMGLPLNDSSGAPLGIIVALHDASMEGFEDGGEMLSVFAARSQVELERNRAEAKLKAAHAVLEQKVVERTRELQRSNQDLDDFASVASHDLQEPLRKIITFGDRLREESAPVLDERSTEYLVRMEKAAIRMRGFIDDLLHYSRVNTSGQSLLSGSLKEAAEKVVKTVLEESIARLGGKVEIGDLPDIEMDRTQMEQLFQNLICNALKFHKPDVPPVVRVTSRPLKGGFYEIAVADNGIGFDEKHVERIFKPFERLHGRSKYEGSGIGLALCRKIVDRHGGILTAKSVVGAGSTFLIVLPETQNPGGLFSLGPIPDPLLRKEGNSTPLL